MTTAAASKSSSLILIIGAAVIGGGVVAAVMSGAFKNEAATPAAASTVVSAPVAMEPAPATRNVEVAPKVEPKHVEQPVKVASAPVAAAPKHVCGNCGVVKSVEEVVKKGDASGGGAVAGAVLGGVAGHQVGEGRGKDLATVIGVVGGAFAGNAVEKNVRKKTEYVVTLSMADGRTESFTLATAPGYGAGDKVKVIDGSPVKQ